MASLLLVLVVGGVWYRAKKHEARSKSLPLEACEVQKWRLRSSSSLHRVKAHGSRPKSVELVETSNNRKVVTYGCWTAALWDSVGPV